MRVFRAVLFVALIAPAAASIAGAQQQPPQPPPSPFGVIKGAVIDSLRGGLLAGGVVGVEGAARIGMTDSAGQFTVDSVPPGEYRLVLMDAALDTMALSVRTTPLRVTAGDTTFTLLAIPSPETVVRAKCGPGPFPVGPAALIGLVVNAETEERVAGATVVLAWSDVQASRETGVRQVPRQRSTRTAADGSFRICGLPSGVNAELIASDSRDSTAVVPFRFDHPLLSIKTLALPGSSDEVTVVSDTTRRPVSTAQQPIVRLRRGRATITGVVQTLGGAPITGARVSVTGADGVALSNERGEFVLAGQPSGTQTVFVRRLGFEPAQFAINLSPGRASAVTVQLPEFVPVLATVTVRGQADLALERSGFTRRQRMGMGRYMELDDIERRGAIRLVDLLTEFPMLRAVSTGGSGRTITGRSRGMTNSCVSFFVDGQLWLGEDSPADYMYPQEIGAIEAYSSVATPAEFSRSGMDCETVVIWTKHKLHIIR